MVSQLLYCPSCTQLTSHPQQHAHGITLKPYLLVRSDLKLSLQHITRQISCNLHKLSETRTEFISKMTSTKNELLQLKELVCTSFDQLYKDLRTKLEEVVDKLSQTENAISKEEGLILQQMKGREKSLKSLEKIFHQAYNSVGTSSPCGEQLDNINGCLVHYRNMPSRLLDLNLQKLIKNFTINSINSAGIQLDLQRISQQVKEIGSEKSRNSGIDLPKPCKGKGVEGRMHRLKDMCRIR